MGRNLYFFKDFWQIFKLAEVHLTSEDHINVIFLSTVNSRWDIFFRESIECWGGTWWLQEVLNFGTLRNQLRVITCRICSTCFKCHYSHWRKMKIGKKPKSDNFFHGNERLPHCPTCVLYLSLKTLGPPRVSCWRLDTQNIHTYIALAWWNWQGNCCVCSDNKNWNRRM